MDNAPAPSPVRQLLVVRLSSMGDVLHTLPAVSALRKALPEVQIGWVVEGRWSELLCAQGSPLDGPLSAQKPLADRVHCVYTKRWRRNLFSPATWRDLRTSLGVVRRLDYEVAIDFQGAIRSAVIARWSGAREILGFAAPREGPARMFYTQKVNTEAAHVVEQNLALAAEFAGVLSPTEPLLSQDPAAETWCDRYCAGSTPGKLVLVNPGAGWGAKQWPAERYGAVARELASEGWNILVNFGPGEERLAQTVASASGGLARPVQCSLGELIALTRRASLFIGGDTGPLHLAAALHIPVVAVFGPTDPARNGPFGTRSIVLRNPESITSHSRRTEAEPGLLRITVDETLAAARELLYGSAA
jgi:heptosyltransferase-1